ncbi:uncharacterized protein M421DRAFT_7012 [Didymella exigua CBS 183.55]|uniref:Ubiquitin 3 binding protein But2 C-terminal domain-containing protein n=1 Tax=Didymella exigua CBS 183.55 TaxID=1150837 RepID=A0A6A5RDQ8_9PLEO|nr:uncharacterized protein M421DRAFT_7012 [Didymella exigua CBS 183.55]KAF1926401.1 hypothetical protein M421DRAFT_7012 [Didymella exigua CBS 183.55]
MLALALEVVATPFPQASVLQDSQLFTLRANCSDEPWHGRYLVNLPTSHRLGLENFTVHPETPGLKFLPILLRDDDNKYALRGEAVGDDLSRTPYLAALTNKATRTVSMKIVYLPTPLRESFDTQTDACPKGYDCTADQWTFDEPTPTPGGRRNIYYNLRFGGFKGSWEPFKDAGKEGWHVYWKGNAGMYHHVQFDLVPVVSGNVRVD